MAGGTLLFHIKGLHPDDCIPGESLAIVLQVSAGAKGCKTPPAGPGDAKGKDSVFISLDALGNKRIMACLYLCLFFTPSPDAPSENPPSQKMVPSPSSEHAQSGV